MARMSTEKRRELLLDSAFRVIAHHGVDGATTRAICAEAGVTLSTFHYVFASRDQLLAALVERGTEIELGVIAAALDSAALQNAQGSKGLHRILSDAMLGYLRGVIDEPEREQAMISLNQYARQTEGLASLGRDMYLQYYEVIAVGLSAAAIQAGVHWDRPTRELSPLVVAATDGITLAYLNTRDRRTCTTIAEAAVTLLMLHVRETL